MFNLSNLLKQSLILELPISSVLFRLVTSLVLGFIISRIFLLYCKKDHESKDMLHSLIFLNLIICTAMMVIGNNLASAFGLVGAVSIIRFRTSVKSSRDMAFVFFTVVIGMACGLGFIGISLISSLIIGSIMITTNKLSNRAVTVESYTPTLKVSYTGDLSIKERIEDVFRSNFVDYKLCELKISKVKVTTTYTLSLSDLSLLHNIQSGLYNLNGPQDLKLLFADFTDE